MDKCSIVLLLVTEICTVLGAILCVVAIGAPSWRHVEVKINGLLIINAHQGLWKNCSELGDIGCTSVDVNSMGKAAHT